MNYTKFLPIPKGQTFSAWVEEWMAEVAREMTSKYNYDDVKSLLTRNENLSSYLATFQVILAAYQVKIDAESDSYAEANPPPDKGIKSWEADRDAFLRPYLQPQNFVKSWYDVCSKRLSVTQSHLRTRSAEASSIA